MVSFTLICLLVFYMYLICKQYLTTLIDEEKKEDSVKSAKGGPNNAAAIVEKMR